MFERSKHSPRIIFPEELWFNVTCALLEGGFLRDMTGAMAKRYIALRYLASIEGRNEFAASLTKLERLDGISPRRAHDVHAMLAEMSLIIVERECKPYRYVLLLPSEWKPAPNRTKGKREVITSSLGPVPWK
jgi:hypothetical protein